MARFNLADSWRRQYDDRAVEWYKLYVGYREPLPEELRGRSNLHVPRTYEIVDTIRARIFKAFTAVRPYIDFVPTASHAAREATVEAEEKARIAAALVDMQLERNEWKRVFYDFLTSLLIFPAAIMAVGWRYERKKVRRRVPVASAVFTPEAAVGLVEWEVREVEVVDWDDNELVNVDFFDFWPDPWGTDIDSCRFVFHREWLTREQLEEKLELLREAGSGRVFMPDFEALRGTGGGLEQGRWRRLSAVGIAHETLQGYEEDGKYLYEVLHYWEDERHAILVNRQELVYDGANPYWRHGRKPFAVGVYEPLPNEFFGLSAVQVIEHLQHELNTHRNQRIDNVSLVLNRMWKVRRTADIDESELVSRPHGVIYVDAPDDVEVFAMPDVTASAYRDEEVIKLDMDNAVGTPDVVRGATPHRRQTATETATRASSAGIRFDVKIAIFETLGLKRMAYLMDCNNQQFIDAPRVVRLFGVEGPEAWRRVEPDELIGEWDYRPSGSAVDPAANKEIRRQQLNELMNIVLRTQNPYVDKYELTKLWLEAYDVRNVEKLLIPREQLAAQGVPQAVPSPGPAGAGTPAVRVPKVARTMVDAMRGRV